MKTQTISGTLHFIRSVDGGVFYSQVSLLALLAEIEAVLLRSGQQDCADVMQTIAAALKDDGPSSA